MENVKQIIYIKRETRLTCKPIDPSGLRMYAGFYCVLILKDMTGRVLSIKRKPPHF